MTAFARQTQTVERGNLTWEIRSVNHRYFECVMRLPESFRYMEVKLRELAKSYISRGKIEAALRAQPHGDIATNVPINFAAAKSLVKATEKISSLISNPAPINVMDILRWPGVVEVDNIADEVLAQAAQVLFDKTLKELQSVRRREGKALIVGIQDRLAQMQTIIADIAEKIPQIATTIREKLKQRIQELNVDEQRLEQEVLFFIQKMDVSEELDRLRVHIDEFYRNLSMTKPVGRRLDFILQEMNREANTLGAKMSQIETAHVAVDLKVLIEQVREQIQNIE